MIKVRYEGWVGRDNWIGFTLKKGEPLLDLTVTEMEAITKYGFKYIDTEFNSIDHAAFCRIDVNLAKIEFKVGGMISEPGSDSKCELVIYDASHPNGLIWGNQFHLKMKSE